MTLPRFEIAVPLKENYRETCATRPRSGRSVREYYGNPQPGVERRR